MTRENPQGIPPHMLHMYVKDDQSPDNSKEFNDDAVRLPGILIQTMRLLSSPVRFVQNWGLSDEPEPDNRPDSAKSVTADHESQYLGEVVARDQRWINSGP